MSPWAVTRHHLKTPESIRTGSTGIDPTKEISNAMDAPHGGNPLAARSPQWFGSISYVVSHALNRSGYPLSLVFKQTGTYPLSGLYYITGERKFPPLTNLHYHFTCS